MYDGSDEGVFLKQKRGTNSSHIIFLGRTKNYNCMVLEKAHLYLNTILGYSRCSELYILYKMAVIFIPLSNLGWFC